MLGIRIQIFSGISLISTHLAVGLPRRLVLPLGRTTWKGPDHVTYTNMVKIAFVIYEKAVMHTEPDENNAENHTVDDKTTPVLEPQANAEVCPQRDGIPVRRRAEVFDQPPHGQPGVATCVQGWG